MSEILLVNGRITTLDDVNSQADSILLRNGKVESVGDRIKVSAMASAGVTRIDLGGRRVIPGLHDSHLHLIRGGLNYNMELRWDGVPSLVDALQMLRAQAFRTPAPQWIRVVGGWGAFQFAEKRMPTLKEINDACGDVPAFILHLYDRALLNGAALRAAGITKDTPDPPGAVIERDRAGNPTGCLIANPNAMILYSTLAKGPKLEFEDQINSTRHFMRELNRLGVTSVIDAGGGFQNYPEDYQVIRELSRDGLLTVRISYNLFTQHPKHEKEDFVNWIRTAKPSEGTDFLRLNGAGEMLVFSAADFEDFVVARPDLSDSMESELGEVIRILAASRWPFRLHATYDESIERFLSVFEMVNADIPFDGLRWFFDHAETISDRNIDRVARLGGGIAIQNRMAFQGEAFMQRYGTAATGRTPPVRKMLQSGLPVGAGTDATRVSSYNPFVSLFWLITGRTVGGTDLYPVDNRLSRLEALQLYTRGSAWFSDDVGKKGSLAAGQFADLAVLSRDMLEIPESDIPSLESVLTIVDGQIVYAADEFRSYDPPIPQASPSWSPTSKYDNKWRIKHNSQSLSSSKVSRPAFTKRSVRNAGRASDLWGDIGCNCWAF